MSSEIHQGKIFNVDELHSNESKLETTAALAELEAPDSRTARQVERNAERERDAATQAATVAKTLGSDYTGEPSTAAGQFKQQASATTDKAVQQGKQDVESAKETGQTFIDQAKAAVNSVIETAQHYISSAVGTESTGPTSTVTPTQRTTTSGQGGQSMVQSAEATATNILHTAQESANAAYNTVRETAHPHIERAKAATQGMTGMVDTQGADLKPAGNLAKVSQPQNAGTATVTKPPASSTGIPATTAPLESGKHKVDATTYPSTTSNLRADELARNAESRN
jgi:hypothetical protein